MKAFADYDQYDATGLAELIKSNQVSAEELLLAAIERADQHEGLNAIIHRFDEKALAKAKSVSKDVLFAGVPTLIKDLGNLFAGEPITMGSQAIDWVPDYDDEFIQRYKATGVIPFGKTNVPEFGINITTEPKRHGPTHNPHKKGYSSGGSSGGSAAAVAAGIVPIATANDGGGSIRFPASWCGVFGLKPSRGRVPLGPDEAEGWSGAVAGHVVTRTVRDSAAMLDAISGMGRAAPYGIQAPEQGFLASTEAAFTPMKIAVSQQCFIETALDPQVKRALEQTVQQLKAMGHEVVWKEPKLDSERYWRDFFIVTSSNMAQTIPALEAHFGQELFSKLEPSTKGMTLIGRTFSATEFLDAKYGWHKANLAMAELFDEFDVVLCPTVPTPAVKHGELVASKLDEYMLEFQAKLNSKMVSRTGFSSQFGQMQIKRVLSKMTYTILGNMTGLPAASVPMFMSDQGLPIGMQFYAPMAQEERIFKLAAQIEKELGFNQPLSSA